MAALGARLAGIDHLLPHAPEPDAYLVMQAQATRRSPAAPPEHVLEVASRKYPHLLSHMLSSLPLGIRERDPQGRVDLAGELAEAARPYVEGRALVALLASLAVPLTYWLARRFVRPSVALLAAALIATSLLHFYLSQQARPHGAFASLALAALGSAAWASRRGDLPAFAVSGACVGLALSCLHSGVFLLPPLFVAWWLTQRKRGARGLWSLAQAVAWVVAALLLAYPFLWTRSAGGEGASLTQHLAHEPASVDPRGFSVLLSAFLRYDPLLLATLLLGLLVGVRALIRERVRWNPELLVVLAFVLPYTLAIGLYSRSYERFALPLWPCFALLAAFGVASLARLARARERTAFALLAALLVLPQAAFVGRKLALNLRPDTYEVAAGFLAEHFDPAIGPILLGPGVYLPLLGREQESTPWPGPFDGMYRSAWRDHLRARVPGSRHGIYEFGMAPSRALELGIEPRGSNLRRRAMRAALRESGGSLTVTCAAKQADAWTILDEALRLEAELVRTVSSFPEDLDHLADGRIGYQDDRFVWVRLLRRERLGPTLRIWRLRAPVAPEPRSDDAEAIRKAPGADQRYRRISRNG